MSLVAQDKLDTIWQYLTYKNNVLVLITECKSHQQVLEKVKCIFDFLRPCGVIEESALTMQLQNEAWLICRKYVPGLPTEATRNLTTILV